MDPKAKRGGKVISLSRGQRASRSERTQELTLSDEGMAALSRLLEQPFAAWRPRRSA